MEKFELSHVMLYAKGWYEHSDDIFKDLKQCLCLDDYSGDLMSNTDVMNLILNHCQKLNLPAFELSQFVYGIRPESTYRCAYYHNQSPDWCTKPEWRIGNYDMTTAVLYYCMSHIRFLESDNWIKAKPIYSNGLTKPKHITKKKINDHFKNIEKQCV